jgi:SAM-dependent methyltransferase
MKARVALGSLFIRLGKLIASLAIMIMHPRDLIEFNRRFYSQSESVQAWGKQETASSDLHPNELDLLEEIPAKQGRLLLLGLGGGREAIPLARMGYEVFGVDFVPEMVAKAKENAILRGVRIEGFAQEMSKLAVAPGTFDMVWLSRCMYSSIPGQRNRIRMLAGVRNALKPGGYFACGFYWDLSERFSPRVELARRVFAAVTLGNLEYEKGDMLWAGVEFIHAFSSEERLRSEFEDGGFEICHVHSPKHEGEGEAILRKSPIKEDKDRGGNS